jgi:hypothetical protein
MRNHDDDLPIHQAMKRAHRIRRFRRSNEEHSHARSYLAHKQKPWKNHNPVRTAA